MNDSIKPRRPWWEDMPKSDIGFYWNPQAPSPQEKARNMRLARRRGWHPIVARAYANQDSDRSIPLNDYLPEIFESFWEHDKMGRRVKQIVGITLLTRRSERRAKKLAQREARKEQ